MADAKARLQEIINAYLEKDSDIVVDTGVVASHIAQMKLFGIRQGVEFFPSQDNFGAQRKDFLDRVIKYNKLDTRLDSIWEYFMCDGKGLFYTIAIKCVAEMDSVMTLRQLISQATKAPGTQEPSVIFACLLNNEKLKKHTLILSCHLKCRFMH